MVNRGAIVVAVVLAGAAATWLPAAAAEPARLGTVVSVTGAVELGREGAWQPAREQGPLFEGQVIRTGEAASAEILFEGDTPASLGEKAEIAVEDLLLKAQLEKVKAKIAAPKSDVKAEIQVTPLTGVRGTEKTEEKAGDLKREHYWNESAPPSK